jgi:hypothetical protein
MATLKSRIRWKKWAPDLGENRTLEGGPALYLELATDLTAQQLEEAAEKLTARGEPVTTRDELLASMRARFSEALGPYVRVHGGPHTVDGQPLATFDDYLALVTQGAGLGASQLRELQAAVVTFNSISGPDELFSLPRSGGGRTTDAQSNDAAASPTDSR